MYKHILVAVDGSSASDSALIEAIKLAKNQKAYLRIVYALDSASVVAGAQLPNPVGTEQAWINAGHEILGKAMQKAQAAGIEVETKLLATDTLGQEIAAAIVHEAKAWPSDLLVAGTHGHRGFNHLLMGSVAEDILRITPVPVLMVRIQ